MSADSYPLQKITSTLLPLPHGCFTRDGGCSTGPYASLNIGYSTGDSPRRVDSNRERICNHLKLDRLVAMHQVHGEEVLTVTGPPREDHENARVCDALITSRPGIGLLVQHADCQPILLHDPRTRAIGAVHSGWRGSVANIAAKTIAAMQRCYGTEPADINAFVGPSLGPCCAEFINFKEELPGWMHPFQVKATYFDFWEITRQQLLQAGVPENQIELAAVCTRCSNLYFSYRRTQGRPQRLTGRNGSVIALPR